MFQNATDQVINNDIETLKGTVSIITYFNEENGYAILKIDNGEKLIPVSCIVPSIQKGEDVILEGVYQNHPKYGMQFKASNIKTLLPDTKEGILSILENGFLPNVGQKTAKLLVNSFGKDVFKVIEESPERLEKIKGLSKKKIEKIIQSYSEKKHLKDILEFAQTIGIGTTMATRIYDIYKDNTIKAIKTNPYGLIALVKGISFKKADDIALKLNLDKNSPERIKAGLSYILDLKASEGHCCYPKRNLIESMNTLLDVDLEITKEILEQEIENKNLIEDNFKNNTFIFKKYTYECEKQISEKLATILKEKRCSVKISSDIDTLIEKTTKSLNISLSKSQIAGVKTSLSNKVSIITGGPGVGKTTVIRTIVDIYRQHSAVIYLSAPTGRAAKRMTEATKAEAKTIHRLLEYVPPEGFSRNSDNYLDCDVLIVDETSMVDVFLMKALLDAVPPTATLIIVGDVDQLPSVGAGQVLLDLISSNSIPVSRLTEIFRQSKESKIITNAHFINKGMNLEINNDVKSDFFFVESNEPEDCVNKILQIILNNAPKRWGVDPLKDIQVLCPMKASAVGTETLNLTIQKELNKNIKIGEKQALLKGKKEFELTNEEMEFKRKYNLEVPFLKKGEKRYAIGDKVMQLKNNYDKNVFNGDIGYITHINTQDKKVTIAFEDVTADFEYEELSEISLAYASTIHKSQGSEYPIIIIPVMKQHYMMLQRKLLYTGVTRGKKIVILVGQKEAVKLAIQGKKEEFNRYTKLKEWLIENN